MKSVSDSFMKPAVPRAWLIAMAGILWSLVGLQLCRLAFHWINGSPMREALPIAGTAVLLSVLAYRFGFSAIARKNILRLENLPDKGCIFAFQAWKSYLIIAAMISFGITLRHSAVPRLFLAVIYATIGGALLLSSFHYYGKLWLFRSGKSFK